MGLGPSLCADRGGRMSRLVGPDVRAFRRRWMSGLGGRMSGLEWWHLLLSGSEGPDFRAGGQMSGSSGEAGCPGPVASGGRAAVVGGAPWARCPGSWPDVRGLGDVLGSFRWFSSSVDLGTCTSSCASSGGSSWCLIMHNTSDLGSSHVSCIEGGSSERSEFTLSSIALARACVIGPSGVVGGVGASMGMILGCSASNPVSNRRIHIT